MHPIEWLRAVARSGNVPHAELASEAAGALAAVAGDPHELLPSCRRLLDRNPTAGPLWWACARLLTAADPVAEARAVQSDLSADQVGLSLALDLPDDATVAVVGWSEVAGEIAARRGDIRLLIVTDDATEVEDDGTIALVPPLGLGAAVAASDLLLLDADAVGTSEALVAPGSLPALATALRAEVPVWLTVSVGRRLPPALFGALVKRLFPPGVDRWQVPAELVDIDPIGIMVEPLVIPCPAPPELLGRTS